MFCCWWWCWPTFCLGYIVLLVSNWCCGGWCCCWWCPMFGDPWWWWWLWWWGWTGTGTWPPWCMAGLWPLQLSPPCAGWWPDVSEVPEHGLPSFTKTGTATRRGELWACKETNSISLNWSFCPNYKLLKFRQFLLYNTVE